MKYLIAFAVTIASLPHPASAGNGKDTTTHVATFRELTHRWYFVSDELKTYEGLSRYCLDPAFRNEVVETLGKIHEYDSTLYVALTSLYQQNPNRGLKKALKKLGHIEHKYTSLSLSRTLKNECQNQRQLERNYRKVKNYFGAHSFDNQVLLTEAYLDKHVDRINRLMARIEDHIHHIDNRR